MANKPTIAIVGAGAAGLMAAVVAAREGAEVLLLEKTDRVGKKILATGNGRCNMTNIDIDASYYHSNNPHFVHSALAQFDQYATFAFFEELGIETHIEADGRVFPMSLQASSILDVLRFELQQLGVAEEVEAKVVSIEKQHRGFLLELANHSQIKADKVLIATGGKAAPNLGSAGEGHELALRLGHSVIPPYQALVQLRLDSPYLKRLKGIKFEGQAEVIVNENSVDQAKGEILFAGYGISGPPILDLSRAANEHLLKGHEVVLKVTVLPQYSLDELDRILLRRFSQQPRKTMEFSFVGLINKQLAPVLLLAAGIDDTQRYVAKATAEERRAIAQCLLDWRFKVTGTQPWSFAQATAGGVDVDEIDPRTMQSRLYKGLYFAGEVMDVDGDCGGYNLQWAWSSGYVAAKSMCN